MKATMLSNGVVGCLLFGLVQADESVVAIQPAGPPGARTSTMALGVDPPVGHSFRIQGIHSLTLAPWQNLTGWIPQTPGMPLSLFPTSRYQPKNFSALNIVPRAFSF